MQAIQLVEPEKFCTIEIPEPSPPGPGEALVRSHQCGICGTDVSGYLGKMPFFEYPRIPGHELGVEVVAVGSGVTQVAVGDRCSVEPYMHCGRCYACRQGAINCCEQLQVHALIQEPGRTITHQAVGSARMIAPDIIFEIRGTINRKSLIEDIPPIDPLSVAEIRILGNRQC